MLSANTDGAPPVCPNPLLLSDTEPHPLPSKVTSPGSPGGAGGLGRSGWVSGRLSGEHGPPQDAEVPWSLGGGPELGQVEASLSCRGRRWSRRGEACGQACMQWGRPLESREGGRPGEMAVVRWSGRGEPSEPCLAPGLASFLSRYQRVPAATQDLHLPVPKRPGRLPLPVPPGPDPPP